MLFCVFQVIGCDVLHRRCERVAINRNIKGTENQYRTSNYATMRGRTGVWAGFFSMRVVRASVPINSIVEMPAPTAASVRPHLPRPSRRRLMP